MADNPFHPEGIYACDGCERTYGEYINGCIYCWDDDLSVEENRRRFPRRKVRLIVPEADNGHAIAPPEADQNGS